MCHKSITSLSNWGQFQIAQPDFPKPRIFHSGEYFHFQLSILFSFASSLTLKLKNIESTTCAENKLHLVSQAAPCFDITLDTSTKLSARSSSMIRSRKMPLRKFNDSISPAVCCWRRHLEKTGFCSTSTPASLLCASFVNASGEAIANAR